MFIFQGTELGGNIYNAPFFKFDKMEDLPETLYNWIVEEVIYNFPRDLKGYDNDQ